MIPWTVGVRCQSVVLLVVLVIAGCTDPGTDESAMQWQGSVEKSAGSVVALTASGGIAGAIGSGVIVGAGGYVLIADHVASSGLDIEIATRHGSRSVSVIARDPVLDLQLVHAPGLRGPVVSGLRGTELEPGTEVWAVGAGNGSRTPRAGTVTATETVVDAILPAQPLIETDIRLTPGDSGGALLDADGRLAGLLVGTRVDVDRVQAVSIPAAAIGRFLDRIESEHWPERGTLGLELREVREPGLVVVALPDRGAAGVEGLQVGDRITHINGESVRDRARLQALVAAMGPGRSVRLDVVRGNEYLQREVTTTLLPQPGWGQAEE